MPLRQQWESVRDELRLIRIFQELGVRMMHLTYNRRNPIGDGAGEPNDGGLERLRPRRRRRDEPARRHRGRGALADGARACDAAKASTKPMVASHTTCAGLYKHFRGKPDETIKAICDTGGLVGICCIPRFLGGAGDIGAFLDHLDYVVKKFGADHVAIGRDMSYVSRNDEDRACEDSRQMALGLGRPADAGSTCGRRTITSPSRTRSKASRGPTGRSSPSAWCSAGTATRQSEKSLGKMC